MIVFRITTRQSIKIAWIAAGVSLASMAAGHMGTHTLSWKENQISSYAAHASYDYLISTSMLSAAFLLLLIGALASKQKMAGSSYLNHLIAPLSGAGAAGLIMLCYFEERAESLRQLKQSGFQAIREQSFHDAGLLLFFYASLLLTAMLGTLALLHGPRLMNRAIGLCVMALAPATYLLMRTDWPGMIGISGTAIGIQQRAALFCLWLASALFLIIAANTERQRLDSQAR